MPKISNSTIEHTGAVTAIEGNTLIVRVVSGEACSSCQAKGLCSSASSKETLVRAQARAGEAYNIGDEVEVAMRESLGLKAVFYSYVVPVVILVILSVSLQDIFSSELYAGLAAIGGAALYYALLRLFRVRFEKEYTFVVK